MPVVTATFKNYDGTVLDFQVIGFGLDAVDPVTRLVDPITTPWKTLFTNLGMDYSYDFTGWDTPLTGLLVDTEFTAQFVEPEKGYARFYNWDGTLLDTQRVYYGNYVENPITRLTNPIAEPTKPGEPQPGYVYDFDSWDTSLLQMLVDTNYTAVFLEKWEMQWSESDFTFTTNATATLITNVVNSPAKNSINVPMVMNGYPVFLNTNAFQGKSYINTIAFQEGVKGIENRLDYMFASCTNLVNAPVLPADTTDLQGAFGSCRKLVNPPIIPNSVINMQMMFESCSQLVIAPIIPDSVVDMSMTFFSCIRLVNAQTIGTNVTNMYWTFYNCANLVKAPIIPDSVVDMSATFSNCPKLVNAPIIPNKVTNMLRLSQGAQISLTLQ